MYALMVAPPGVVGGRYSTTAGESDPCMDTLHEPDPRMGTLCTRRVGRGASQSASV